jgi:hypothetical protein
MPRVAKSIAQGSFKRLLAAAGSVVSLVGLATTSCPAYGPPVVECHTNADCEASRGKGWYCDSRNDCVEQLDGGSSDAGK